MRVLLVALVGSRSPGGGRTFMSGLAAALGRGGDVELVLVTQEGTAPLVPPGTPNVHVHEVDAPPWVGRLIYEGVATDRLARKFGCDLVHYPHEWVPPGNTPTVISWQSLGYLSPAPRRERAINDAVYRVLARLTLTRARRVIAVSKQVEDVIRAGRASRLPAERIVYVPEGFDVTEMSRLRGSGSSGEIMAVAGAAPYKNARFLREVIDRAGVGAHRWVVIGDDPPARRGLETYAHLPRPVFLERLARAEVLVFPTLVEAFGLPALEALALGTPVIVLEGTSMALEWPDLVTALPPDPAVWAEHLLEERWRETATRLDQPATSDRLAATYSWDEVARRTVEVYEEALG